MPRVSEEHRERRRQQILDAAQRCFVRKGFHKTSLQEIFRESGLSAGAVYGYFRSKDDLIRAIAARSEPQVSAILEEILDTGELPPLDEIVARFAAGVIERMGSGGGILIAPQGWALATYNPAVHEAMARIFSNTRSWWTRVAERLQDDGRLAPDADPHAVGAVLTSIITGFIVQRLLLGDVDAETLREGMRTLLSSDLGSSEAVGVGNELDRALALPVRSLDAG
ncbi:TetR/AcrR family transcriptional regulator [Actinomadura rudentiformis]|uniref:TetR/AcrR family transcriptional regulator n=1 Tax=Actinomadura rudentiformis TaxID=359158 RepID=A0A6H9Z6V1_9ACTN|nr:TetR/AcrR family transcriptional regulator [Actinomadura rudentiformis]KAB2350900.1 TetR/AcrR family transcriptional regulator [Actinomadura rudentiformis]